MHKKSNIKKKYLIITADDFGANSNINKAIELAFNDGILNCASLMAASSEESFEEAIDIAKQNPKLDIGVHLTLVSDNNIYQKALSYGKCDKGLTRGGYFLDLKTFVLQNSFFKLNNQIIEKEIRLQIERVMRTGLTPSYLNSHYFISELPFIKSLELKLAVEYGIKCVRKPYQKIIMNNERLFNISNMMESYLGLLIIRGLVSINNIRNQELSELIKTNDYFFGIMDTFRSNKTKLIGIIKNIKSGLSEILFHPSIKNSEYYNEEYDFQMLIDPDIKETISLSNIKLINYKDLAEL